MKSRYRNLHRIGTLSIILAWIVLVLGILTYFGVVLGLNQFSNFLSANFEGVAGLGAASWLAALPGLLFAILGWLQFYVIGKVLHLLVDLDERSVAGQPVAQAETALAPAATAGDSQISGELNRQAKLIASNLEATQGLQQQIASLQAKLGGLPAPAAASASTPSSE